jgi:hypothetical protein
VVTGEQSTFGRCVFGFLTVSGHVVAAAFDAFVRSRAGGVGVAVKLTSCTLYDSLDFVRRFYHYFHIAEVLQVVDIFVVVLGFKVHVEHG